MKDQTTEFKMAVAGNQDTWVPGAGGHEPISMIEGKRYQWCFNPKLRRHAYYCYETDLILIDGLEDQLPRCLRS